MPNTDLRARSLVPYFLFLAGMGVCYFVFAFMLSTSFAADSIEDSGWISLVNIAILLVVVSIAARQAWRADRGSGALVWSALTYVLLVYLAREADLHRSLTPEHVTRIQFYGDPAFPLMPKLVAGFVLLLFAVAFLGLAIRFGGTCLRDLRRGTPWAIAFATGVLFLALSQGVDQSGLRHVHAGPILEEFLELSAACLVFMALVQFPRSQTQSRMDVASPLLPPGTLP